MSEPEKGKTMTSDALESPKNGERLYYGFNLILPTQCWREREGMGRR